MATVDKDKLKPVLAAAEKGDAESRAVVAKVLMPTKDDSVEDIYLKIRLFIRINYFGSLKYEDSPAHKEIDMTYAEQVHSYINKGVPQYEGLILIGYRESAKTTRVKMNQSYVTVYLKDLIDYINVVSEDGSSSAQFNMDMFNTFAFSKISLYYPNTISNDFARGKKESQTMSRFTTTDGVTYAASGSRKTKRGGVQVNIDDAGEIENKRPKLVVFDDIENEVTIKSPTLTQGIKAVMDATIDGLDQQTGFWILLGNYLSLRGNVNYFLKKYENNPRVKIIMIPIVDGEGTPTWPGKYVATDKEQLQLSEKGIQKVSIESIKRKSDNYDTEYLNNPSRSRVYFNDDALAGLDEEILIEEHERDEDGLIILREPEKSASYIVGLDAAKGNGGDEASFTVYKTTGLRFEEVANFKSNKMSPEKLAPYSVNIFNRYNHALVVPEENYPGNEYIAFLRPLYNNIYKVEKSDGEFRYGVNTNLKTKPEMFLHFKKLLLDELIKVRSRALYSQILEYPAQDLNVIKQKDNSGATSTC